MAFPAEASLIARCRRGESEAWDELFDLYYGAAGRFILQLSHDFSREDVEEICQDTFLTVIRSLDSFRGQSQFQTWLFRIAANKAHDFRQRRQAAKRGGGQFTLPLHHEDPETGFTIDPPGTLPGPDQLMVSAENVALVGRALDHLALPCQEVIQLRYFGDLSYEEIAIELQLNPKTVSSRLSKCLDKLEALARNLLAQDEAKEKKSSTAV
jgi:RNA polymerase sigma-70 factor (ECF subfamily)